jgi:diadenosine tetraphosphate (Ap4A) HIT family hydrolase
MTLQPGCPLCETVGGTLVARTPRWRVIRADDPAFPALYRVIWNEHRAEFTDLSATERAQCMEAVCTVESVLREWLKPTKINLASVGNFVPHVHWHVIARFDWDSHFPQTVWAAPMRSVDPASLSRLPVSLEVLDTELAKRLGALA